MKKLLWLVRADKNTHTEPGYAGMVTVETAMGIMMMTIFFLMMCGFLTACLTKIRAIDVARECARTAAQGKEYIPQRRESSGQIETHQDGEYVYTTVCLPVPALEFTVCADSQALRESPAS